MLRLSQKDTDETLLFERWCQKRVEAIDMVSGLNDDCVAFLDLAVEHGCDVGLFLKILKFVMFF